MEWKRAAIAATPATANHIPAPSPCSFRLKSRFPFVNSEE
jgi:hypothetical protein